MEISDLEEEERKAVVPTLPRLVKINGVYGYQRKLFGSRVLIGSK